MKFIVQFILIALFTYVGQFFLPWWGVFFLAGSVGMMVPSKGFTTFLAGFLSVALLWFLQVYLIDAANESILSTKVATIFTLGSSMQLMLASALIGGICGGFGALTGTFLADMLRKKKEVHSVYS